MATTILGINAAYHESAVCLLRDGVILNAVEEERFNRIKHAKHARVDNADELPEQALEWSLRAAGLTPDQIDHIGFSFDPEERLRCNRNLGEKGIPPGDYGTPEGEETFHRSVYNAAAKLRQRFPKAQFHFLRHHLCHAASTFYPSRHERAAVLAIDGIGEFTTTWMGIGDGHTLKPIHEISYPHSLGFVWEKMSEHLGFDVYGGPGKVMGYACLTDPVGEASGIDYAERFRRIIQLTDTGFTVDNSVMRFRTRDFSGLEPLFGPRRPSIVDRYEEASIAAGLQTVTEEVFIHLARLLYRKTGMEALCLAGGVALNCVANARLLRETPFRALHVMPAANDAGTAVGAACLLWCQVLGNRTRPRLDHAYLGPEYSETEIKAALDQAGLAATRPDDLPREVARLVYDGKIVAWFQGRLEFGPRALGHRSILGDPSRFDMRSRLNHKVKERESFRPFAPSVLPEDIGRHLQTPADLDAAEYMLLALPVVERRDIQRIPAVIQENGTTGHATARPHVVRPAVNPLYHRLLQEMKAISGLGMILNTSFNISEPIVATPEHAINCFQRSKMDALAIGPFLVKR
ncbi:MAG: carbamoyl transferase [Candidatus Ozemobacter sibiricus]|uniref:Carbamoyl transferase n=1 Tax=Candidatus Ozemobacter sibiricus TaxID=2268124 RepID=A0A367ZSK2_9BACT|nr:MAG: carbamoyl transferase [Candidatus Ozemobacter sibiricus]